MMIKTLGTAALVTAALAGTAFAQDASNTQQPVHALRQHYRGTYNQVQEPAFVSPRGPAGNSYFGGEGRDPSRVGGYDPSFNPSGS